MATRKKTPATRKKAAKKTVAKATKKTITKTSKKSASKREPIVLSADARQRVPKPREGWEQVLERALDTWEATPRLKVPGLTLAKLTRLGTQAGKAAERERELAAKQARSLRPLSDARLVREGEAWSALLELHAAVKYHARQDPALLDQFSFLADVLKNERE
ncbi:hypothetical protein [Sandaracinus amylolyticus]|uniref:Uncharacterized protein n=1 Tax=Sandaracinus amylolyticus TaxID=927083 RepID=A0A0F6YFY0_9BACT|nr:hypothetical protein [Sandaracinus amylolyticus]AKF02963.1 hypothetical protein DB32_000111 [Sandaracinus amylolyticus]